MKGNARSTVASQKDSVGEGSGHQNPNSTVMPDQQ